jgi:hypothetical protein
MSFSVMASNSAGASSFACATASDAVDQVLKLEQQGYKHFTIRDDAGRMINLDQLSALCEAGEDRPLGNPRR